MKRTEILLILVLVISLLSLWFSYKTYERKMRKHQHVRCGCGYFSEGYSGGGRGGAERIIQHRDTQIYEKENKNISFPRPQPTPQPDGCLGDPCSCYPDSPYC